MTTSDQSQDDFRSWVRGIPLRGKKISIQSQDHFPAVSKRLLLRVKSYFNSGPRKRPLRARTTPPPIKNDLRSESRWFSLRSSKRQLTKVLPPIILHQVRLLRIQTVSIKSVPSNISRFENSSHYNDSGHQRLPSHPINPTRKHAPLECASFSQWCWQTLWNF